MNLLRKHVLSQKVLTFLVIGCFLHSAALAESYRYSTEHLAPPSSVKQTFLEFSEKYAEEDADAYPFSARRQSGAMHHVNFVPSGTFLFPREVLGVEGVNVVDLVSETVREARRRNLIPFGVEDVIVNIWGSLSYYIIDGSPAWDDIEDIDMRIYTRNAPTEGSIRALNTVFGEILRSKGIVFESPVRIDDLVNQKKVQVTLKGKKSFSLEIYVLEDRDMFLTGNYATKYDPWTYYQVFSAQRQRDLDAIADKIFAGDLYANIFAEYTRWYAEVTEAAQSGTVPERLKALKRIAQMLQIRGKEERAAEVLKMYSLFRAQAESKKGVMPSDLPVYLKNLLQTLRFTQNTYDKVQNDIKRAVIIKMLLHDPGFGASPHRARIFLSRSLGKNDPMRDLVLKIIKPMKEVSLQERLDILRSMVSTEYMRGSDVPRILKIAGIGKSDVVMHYCSETGAAVKLSALAQRISSETGFTPGEIRAVIDGLAQRQKIVIIGAGDAMEVMSVPRYVSMIRDGVREPDVFGDKTEGLPEIITSFRALSGAKRRLAQTYLLDIFSSISSDGDLYDFVTRDSSLGGIFRQVNGLPDAVAEQIFRNLQKLNGLNIPDRMNACMYARDIIQTCIEKRDFQQLDDAFALLMAVMHSSLETKYRTAMRISKVVGDAILRGQSIGAMYQGFTGGLRIHTDLAAAYFVHIADATDGNGKVIETMRHIMQKIEGEDRAQLAQLLCAFQDSVSYFGTYTPIMFHFLHVVSGEEKIDVRKLTKVFLAFVVIFEYIRNNPSEFAPDFMQFRSVRTIENCYAVLFEYLNRIDGASVDKPSFGAATVDFIDDVNKGVAYDNEHADIVLQAHPFIPSRDGMTVAPFARINVNVVPSARIYAQYPDMQDIAKPGHKTVPERGIGQIACAFGLLKGSLVLYIGAAPADGYVNLNDKVKKKIADWRQEAVRRVEEMARAHGAKMVLVPYREKVRVHDMFPETDVENFYKALLKRGYRLSPRAMPLKLSLGEHTGRFYFKDLFKTEQPELPEIPWLAETAPFAGRVSDMRLIRDVVMKEKAALTPEMLMVNMANDIVFNLRIIRHDVGNIIFKTTAKVKTLAFKNKISNLMGETYPPDVRKSAEGLIGLIDALNHRGVELCELMNMTYGAKVARSDGLSQWLKEYDKIFDGKYRYDAATGTLIVSGQMFDTELQALLNVCVDPQERSELEYLYRVSQGPYDRMTAENVMSKTAAQSDVMLRDIAVMDGMLDDINAGFTSLGFAFEELPICRGSFRKARYDIEEFKASVQNRPAAEELEEIDLAVFLTEYLSSLKHFGGLKYTEVSLDVAPGVPPVRVYRKALENVLMNMARNAGEAMAFVEQSKQKFIISVSVDATGSKVSIALSDTGKGIPEQNLDKIFDLDFTFDKVGGTGLGLFVSKSMIEKMGGSVSVRSKVHQGTTFTLSFPSARRAGDSLIAHSDMLMQGVNLAALSTAGKLSDSADPFLRLLADYDANNLYRRFMQHVDIDGEVIVGSPVSAAGGVMTAGEKVGAGGMPVDIVPDIIQLSKGITKVNHRDTVSMTLYTEKDSVMKLPNNSYLKKIIVGKDARGANLDVSQPIGVNLSRIAEALSAKKHIPVGVRDLRGAVLFRNRHKQLIRDIIRSGVKLHRKVDPDNGLDFDRFWIGVEETIGRDGICQSGNMTFLGDGDIMPVFGLRFDVIDFICGAGGTRDGIMSAVLTQIFKGKMSAQLCARETMKEGRSAVDLDNDQYALTADEKQAWGLAGFVDPVTPDEAIPEGVYRWNHVFNGATLVKGQDLAVFVSGIKGSRWIRGLEGIQVDPVNGTLTVHSLKATKKGDIQLYETVYSLGFEEQRRQIAAEKVPAQRSEKLYRLGVMLCANGAYTEGIKEIAQAADMMPEGSTEHAHYAGALNYYKALKALVSGAGIERYAEVFELLTAALSADPLDRQCAADLMARINQFYGHALWIEQKRHIAGGEHYVPVSPVSGSMLPGATAVFDEAA